MTQHCSIVVPRGTGTSLFMLLLLTAAAPAPSLPCIQASRPGEQPHRAPVQRARTSSFTAPSSSFSSPGEALQAKDCDGRHASLADMAARVEPFKCALQVWQLTCAMHGLGDGVRITCPGHIALDGESRERACVRSSLSQTRMDCARSLCSHRCMMSTAAASVSNIMIGGSVGRRAALGVA